MKTLYTMFYASFKKHLWLFCALLWVATAKAKPVDPDIQRRITEGSQQLKAMIAQNAWNNAHGLSHRNRYVFGDTKWVKVNDGAIGDDAAKEINDLLAAYNTQTEANKVYDYNAVKVYLYLGGMQGFKVKPAPKHKTETKAELIARIKGGLLRKNYLNDKYAEASKKEAAVMNGIQKNVFGGLNRHKYSLMLGVATYLDVVPHKIAKESGETMIWGVHRFAMNAGLKNTNKQLITVLRKLLKPHIGEVIKIEEGNTSQELAKRNRAEAMKNLTRAMLNEVGTCHPVDNPASIEYLVVDYGAPKDFKHPIGGKTLNDENPATARKIWDESIQKVSTRLNQELKKPGIYNLSKISLERRLHNWWNQAHFDWVAKESKFLSIDKQKVSKHGLSIYVVFIEIGFLPASQGDYSLKRFTNEVWRRTKLLKDNHKSVFYFVPLYYATYPGQNKRYGCAYPSLRLGTAYEPSDAKQIHDNIKDLRIKDLGKQLNTIYRALPKPYFEYGLICRVDGSILKASRVQLEVRGKPMRSVRVSYDSVNLARLHKMALQTYGGLLKPRLRQLAAELLIESSVKDYRDMSAYDINLREDSMEEYYQYAALRYLNTKFNELNVKSTRTNIGEYLDGSHFFFGDWKAIPNTAKLREGKDIVEELLEAASFIASFVNADFGFDLALGLYCAYKGKYVDSYLNFVAAAIPGFLDGFFKGEKLLLKKATKQLRRNDLILAKVSKKGSKLIDDLLYTPLQKGTQWLINKSGDRLILSSLRQGVTKKVVIIDPTSIKIADDVPWGYAKKRPNGKPEFLTENLAQGGKQEVYLASNSQGDIIKCLRNGEAVLSYQNTGLYTNLSDQSIRRLKEVAWRGNDQILEVFIHSKGNQYFVYLENASGKLTKVTLGTKELAAVIKNFDPSNQPIRLLSCNNLVAAQNLSKALGNRPVIATDALVRVHPDGGITTVARSGNSSQQWYKLEGGNKVEVSAPRQPEARYKDDFVVMGFNLFSITPDKVITTMKKSHNNLANKITDDEVAILKTLDKKKDKEKLKKLYNLAKSKDADKVLVEARQMLFLNIKTHLESLHGLSTTQAQRYAKVLSAGSMYTIKKELPKEAVAHLRQADMFMAKNQSIQAAKELDKFVKKTYFRKEDYYKMEIELTSLCPNKNIVNPSYHRDPRVTLQVKDDNGKQKTIDIPPNFIAKYNPDPKKSEALYYGSTWEDQALPNPLPINDKRNMEQIKKNMIDQGFHNIKRSGEKVGMDYLERHVTMVFGTFKNGLAPKKNNVDLHQHVHPQDYGNKSTALRGTTKELLLPGDRGAAGFAEQAGIVFVIDDIPAWNTNAIFSKYGKYNKFPEEVEWSIYAEIPPEKIVGAYIVFNKGTGVGVNVEKLIPNPYYKK